MMMMMINDDDDDDDDDEDDDDDDDSNINNNDNNNNNYNNNNDNNNDINNNLPTANHTTANWGPPQLLGVGGDDWELKVWSGYGLGFRRHSTRAPGGTCYVDLTGGVLLPRIRSLFEPRFLSQGCIFAKNF